MKGSRQFRAELSEFRPRTATAFDAFRSTKLVRHSTPRMRVLRISMTPATKELVAIQCTFGDKVVEKTIKTVAKPICFYAVLDDNMELADVEIVTSE